MNTFYQYCGENDPSDKSFLGWIYARLQSRGDSDREPHMQRLHRIIQNMSGKMPVVCDCSVADECPQGRRGMTVRCRIWKE